MQNQNERQVTVFIYPRKDNGCFQLEFTFSPVQNNIRRKKKIEIKPIWITSHQQNFTCNRMKSPTSFSNALASDGQVSPTACICFSKRQYSLPITEKQCQPSSLFLSSLDSTENIPVAFPP